MADVNNPRVFEVYSNRQKLDDKPIVYNSFSGTDITAQILLPNSAEDEPMHLGELQTISYSMHRENKPIRILGRVNPKGFVRGGRTIAGSMIFTVFNTYAFYRLAYYRDLVYGAPSRNRQAMYPLADMLPPFDVILTFVNEYGSVARMKIYGMVIVDEGGTLSIEDIISEQTFTWMASGIEPLTAYYSSSMDYLYETTDGESPNFVNVIRF